MHITNPLTGENHPIHSYEAKQLIKNYIKFIQSGGSKQPKPENTPEGLNKNKIFVTQIPEIDDNLLESHNIENESNFVDTINKLLKLACPIKPLKLLIVTKDSDPETLVDFSKCTLNKNEKIIHKNHKNAEKNGTWVERGFFIIERKMMCVAGVELYQDGEIHARTNDKRKGRGFYKLLIAIILLYLGLFYKDIPFVSHAVVFESMYNLRFYKWDKLTYGMYDGTDYQDDWRSELNTYADYHYLYDDFGEDVGITIVPSENIEKSKQIILDSLKSHKFVNEVCKKIDLTDLDLFK
jgi:hypothetical protein